MDLEALDWPGARRHRPILAILSESDEHHTACVAVLQRVRATPDLLACGHRGGLAFARLPAGRWKTAVRIRLADASLVYLANREGVDVIFTLDRSDFGVLRRTREKKFRVIP